MSIRAPKQVVRGRESSGEFTERVSELERGAGEASQVRATTFDLPRMKAQDTAALQRFHPNNNKLQRARLMFRINEFSPSSSLSLVELMVAQRWKMRKYEFATFQILFSVYLED